VYIRQRLEKEQAKKIEEKKNAQLAKVDLSILLLFCFV